MPQETPRREAEQGLDDLKAAVAANAAAIDELEDRVDGADDRAVFSDERESAQDTRMDSLREHVDVDRAMIADLQAEGLLSATHVAELALALRTARKIGAAIGLVMAGQRVDEECAFEALSKASHDTNTKLRVLAEDLVDTGDVSGLAAREDQR